MTIKPSLILASVLTLLCVLFFVLASPLVPMARQPSWIWIALATGAAATIAWVSTWRAMADRDQKTFHS